MPSRITIPLRSWLLPGDAELRRKLAAIPGVRVLRRRITATEDVAEVVAARVGVPGIREVSARAAGGDGETPPLSASFPPRAFSWQREAAEALATGAKAGLFHACGTGKTGTLLMAARALQVQRMLVLTRAMGRDVYARDAVWAWPDLQVGIVLGTGRASPSTTYALARATRSAESLRQRGARVVFYADAAQAHRECACVVVGYEVLAAHVETLAGLDFDLGIADESHLIKGQFGDRTTAAHRLVSRLPRRWIATATPCPDRLRDLWSQWAWARPESAGSAWRWLHRYTDAKPGRYGGLDTAGTSHVEELRARVLRLFDVRPRSCLDLPPEAHHLIRLPNDAALFGHFLDIETAIAHAAELKAADVLTRAVEALRAGEKVVVVGIRRKWAADLAARITRQASRSGALARSLWLRTLTGEQDVPTRQALAREFLAAPAPACAVATLPAIKESIDLQDTDRVLVAALPWTPGDLIQLRGRFRRPGQQRPVTFEYLIAEGTVDEEVEDLLLRKLSDLSASGAHSEGAGALALPDTQEVQGALSAWLRRSHEQSEVA